MQSTVSSKLAIVLLSKSALAAAPIAEMKRLAACMQERGLAPRVVYAFSEQGEPSLLDTLLTLRRPAINKVLIIPLILPKETSFQNWLTRSLCRWQSDQPEAWPELHIGASLGESPMLPEMLENLVVRGATQPVLPTESVKPAGSIIPAQKRRVLVCQGGACNAAGANAVWSHLRNQQQHRNLRNTGEGVVSAMSTCLGPCSLAPVLQVFPEGTYYGGVDEATIDQIVAEHLLEGKVVEAYAYAPTGKKQFLRPATGP